MIANGINVVLKRTLLNVGGMEWNGKVIEGRPDLSHSLLASTVGSEKSPLL